MVSDRKDCNRICPDRHKACVAEREEPGKTSQNGHSQNRDDVNAH